MGRRFDAVIFDMDGVLLDSEPLHFEALGGLLAHDGLQLTLAENEEFIGATVEATFSTLIARHHLPRSLGEYISLYDEAVLRILQQPRPPSHGVVQLIARTRDLGMRLALASSSRRLWIDATLRSIGLANTFELIVSGDDVEHSKPDPEIYLLAGSRLDLPPERCLAIEDSPNGVKSALAAGMPVVAVRTPSTAHLSVAGALKTVDTLADPSLYAEVLV